MRSLKVGEGASRLRSTQQESTGPGNERGRGGSGPEGAPVRRVGVPPSGTCVARSTRVEEDGFAGGPSVGCAGGPLP